MTHRREILKEASRLTCGDREQDYGPPKAMCQHVANIWTAYLGDQLTRPITAKQVPWMLANLKQARDAHRPKLDNFIDAAAYAAIAGECCDETDNQQSE